MPASGRSGQRWGWHALAEEWAARIVKAADVRPGQLVLDIGAGEGALTAHLVNAGARVIAVELHPRRAAHLRQRFAGDPVKVVQADATTLRLPRQPFRVVANPPYSITATLLRALLAPRTRLIAADLVMEGWLTRRYSEGRAPRAGGWMREYDLRSGLRVPRHAFRPPPRLDSAVLVVRRR